MAKREDQEDSVRETKETKAPPAKRSRQEGDQCVCIVCGVAVIDSDEQRTLHLSMRHTTEVLLNPARDTGDYFEYRAPAA